MEHEDIVKYVTLMSATSNWFGALNKDASYALRLRRLYDQSRFFFFFVLFLLVCVGLYSAESFGLYDGTFSYLPSSIYMITLSYIASRSGPQQDVLISSFNRHFLAHSELWMREMRNKYVKPAYKAAKVLRWYDLFILCLYLVIPRVLDTVLHYGFDYLDTPLQLPEFLTPLTANSSWTLKYYAVSVVNFWAVWEFIRVAEGFIVNYAVFFGFFLSELLIFKQQIHTLQYMDYEVKKEVDENFKNIVTWHNDLIM